MGIRIFLDDNREPPVGWIAARNAEQAMLYLLTQQVDELSLDHDLDAPHCHTCSFSCGLRETGCRHSCSCHSNGDVNGFDLLKWIAENNQWPAVKPQVHSANQEQAPKMRAFIEARWPGGT